MEPLCVVLFSEDRGVLAAMSRALTAFGYRARPVASLPSAMLAIDAEADILLIDAPSLDDDRLALCRAAAASEREPPVLVITGPLSVEEIAAALEAGADDFLRRPVVYGELLARLRVAARLREMQRRIELYEGRDRPTGLPNRLAFLRRIEQEVGLGTCVLIDVDRLAAVNDRLGRAAGDAMLRVTAETLRGAVTADDFAAALGGGRFACLLAGKSHDEAVAWAETTRAELVQSLAQRLDGITASLGVAAFDPGDAAAGFDSAIAALQAAKAAGGDCVRGVEAIEVPRGWPDFTAGQVFDRSTAADILVPCEPLRADDSWAVAAAWFERFQLDAVPVVDSTGNLLGAVSIERRPEDLSDRVEDDLVAPPSFDPGAEFAALREFFVEQDWPAAAIVQEGRPVGVVTPDTLAALTAPIGRNTFAAIDERPPLCVPEVRLL